MRIVSVSPSGVPPSIGGSSPNWQNSLQQAIRDPAELCDQLQLPDWYRVGAERAASQFGLLVPREYLARMRVGDPHDPLLRQVLPVDAENQVVEGFGTDPLFERGVEPKPGLLIKYPGRALLVTTGACAIHCRYCFRRHYPYDSLPTSREAWYPALSELAEARGVSEVILSGGDPLTLSDRRLGWLVEQIESMGHIERIRFHTRLPIVIPHRVTDRFLAMLSTSRLQPLVVLHANHAAELDTSVREACVRLSRAGAMLLNQSVLLAGVNDQVEALRDLSLRLVSFGVRPYYLHQLDRVAGAHHWEVSTETGRRLITELAGSLPGYAVPRYVCELPGAPNKIDV